MQIKLKQLSAALLLCCGSWAMAANAAPLDHLDVFYYNKADSFIKEVSQQLQQKQPDIVKELHEFDANEDVLKQLEQIETSAAKDDQVLVVNIVDVGNGSTVIETAKNSKNPVIFFNREPQGEVFKSYDLAYYIGSHPEQAGRLQGEILVDYLKNNPQADLNKDGVINLVVIKGEASHQDSDLRTLSCLDTLEKNGIKYNVLSTTHADWSYDKAFAEMDRIVTQHGIDSIEAVVSNNDTMALGAIAVLQGYKLNDKDSERTVPVVGIDAIEDAKKAIAAGQMLGSVKNDAAGVANAIIEIATALDEGKQPTELPSFKLEGRYVWVPYVKYVGE